MREEYDFSELDAVKNPYVGRLQRQETDNGEKPNRVTVSLEEIAEKMEETMDHWEQYLNVVTGEFEALSDGTYIETDEELAEIIESSDDYVRLPNQYDIHEYRIMQQFAGQVKDARKQQKLFQALNGRKPYRHFKDEINYHGMAEAYYAFRYRAYVEIARGWCEWREIPYVEKEKRQENN